jgi:hypothetical protein
MSKKRRKQLDGVPTSLLDELIDGTERAIKEDSSRDNIFDGVDMLIELAAESAAKNEMAKVLVALVVIKALLATIEKNPMYDSPALALQFRSAVDSLIAQIRK